MNVITFDLETTGLLDDPTARPVEIGAVRHNLDTGEIVGTFSNFLRPESEYLDDAKFALCKRISGIEKHNIVDANNYDLVLHDFLSWIKDDLIYSWNLPFDQRMLARLFRDHAKKTKDSYFRTKDPTSELCRESNLRYGGCWQHLYTYMHPDRAGRTSGGDLKRISLSRAILYEGIDAKQTHRALSDAEHAARMGQIIYKKLQQ